jgi:dTDP-4-dehydrorhamnose reductase
MVENETYLVIGGNGLIGRSAIKNLDDKYNVISTYYKRKEPNLLKVDITNNKDLKKIFEKARPNYVLNCSNLAGGVNLSEEKPDLAKKFHLDANKSIGTLCEKYSSKFILISTDYVFDGENPPYKEDDETNPLNVYGEIKLDAEKWITSNISKHLIVRTTNVYGWDPKTVTPNYMMSLYRAIKDENIFNAPSFLWGNPTYVNDLTSAIIELCEKEINGIFHIVGSSYINRYDWALKACTLAGWNKTLINEKKDVPANIVPRPLKSNLSTEKFNNVCKTKLNNVDEGLKFFIKNMNDDFYFMK